MGIGRGGYTHRICKLIAGFHLTSLLFLLWFLKPVLLLGIALGIPIAVFHISEDYSGSGSTSEHGSSSGSCLGLAMLVSLALTKALAVFWLLFGLMSGFGSLLLRLFKYIFTEWRWEPGTDGCEGQGNEGRWSEPQVYLTYFIHSR